MTGFLEQVFSTHGDKLEYAKDLVITPGDPALGRRDKTERQWIKFDAAVGKPRIDPNTNSQQARLLTTAIQFHTTTVIDKDTIIRWEGRLYQITNDQAAAHL